MSTEVLSCDDSIWFINWNRCGKTGGHSQAQEGLKCTMGKQHDKIPPLASKATCWFDGRTQKIPTEQIPMTALKMKVFTLSNLTYGSWKQGHLPWWVNASESSYGIQIVHNSIAFKEKRKPLLTSSNRKLVQIRSTVTFTYIIYTISEDNPHMSSYMAKLLRKMSPFSGGGGYNVLLLLQQISLK